MLALHLVADGGRHYWIEPESLTALRVPLTDDAALRELYGNDRYRGNAVEAPSSSEITAMMRRSTRPLASVGRFGIRVLHRDIRGPAIRAP